MMRTYIPTSGLLAGLLAIVLAVAVMFAVAPVQPALADGG